jgi:predicted RND superfamily exporter protein
MLATMVVAGLSLYGAAQLQFSHDPIKWLPENSPVRMSMEKIGEKIGGTVPVEIVLDTGEIDGIKDPEFLKSLDEVVASMEKYKTDKIAVGKVVAVSTLIKETNQALYDNDPGAYVIPGSRELIAQELLMLESAGAKDLMRLVDSNYQKARITVLTPWVDALYFGDYINGLHAMLQNKFEGKAQIQVTGIVPMLSKTLKKIMRATAMSYAFAFVVITLMMIMLLGSVKYGLISVLPNVLPITMVLALMHVAGAPLDMFSILIGSIAMGLAVDDTVHFMDGFRTIYQKTGDAERAIAETMNVSGRAMLSTGIVLSLGFLIYLFSPMHNLEDFGMYSALCILAAMLADFWITPAILLYLHSGRR